MSVVCESEDGWILSHAEFFSHMTVSSDEAASTLLTLNPTLFAIKRPFIRTKGGQGHAQTDPSHAGYSSDHSACPREVQTLFTQLVAMGRTKNIFVQEKPGEEEDRNTAARQAANQFYKEMNLNFIDERLSFHGANTSNVGVMSTLSGHSFLFPPNTTFYSGDIHEVIQKHFTPAPHCFDLILIDPPWKNKFIWRNRKRRQNEGGGYEVIDNVEIESLPIERLCAKGALVVVWSTNAGAHQDNLINKIFPTWHVTHLTTWYWVKVTEAGEAICPFNSPGKKQPYEAIIIGRQTQLEKTSTPMKTGSPPDLTSEDFRRTKVILSLPSCLHSHKPPLIRILSKYLPKDAKCCELFARYLIPGFTSIGNEVLKLQHSSLFLHSQPRGVET